MTRSVYERLRWLFHASAFSYLPYRCIWLPAFTLRRMLNNWRP